MTSIQIETKFNKQICEVKYLTTMKNTTSNVCITNKFFEIKLLCFYTTRCHYAWQYQVLATVRGDITAPAQGWLDRG